MSEAKSISAAFYLVCDLFHRLVSKYGGIPRLYVLNSTSEARQANMQGFLYCSALRDGLTSRPRWVWRAREARHGGQAPPNNLNRVRGITKAEWKGELP